MNKHMKNLSTLKPEELKKRHDELLVEIVTIRKSVKLGNTQNYHAATTKRREVARIKALLSGGAHVEQATVDKKTAKEKK